MAQVEEPSPYLLFENQTVFSTSKIEEKAKDAPGMIVIITKEDIQNKGYLDLKDLIKDLPSFYITPNVGGENGGFQVLQRGIHGNNKILVLIDGFPLNAASGDRFVWGNHIPLHYFEQIEILYGPASALYGSDAFSGVINMIPKKGTYQKPHEIQSFYGSEKTYGGYYLYRKETGEHSDLLATFRIYRSQGFDFKKEFPEIYGKLDSRYQSEEFSDQGLREFKAPIKDYNLFLKWNFKNFSLMATRSHYHENNTRGEKTQIYVMNEDAYWEFDKDILAMQYKAEINDQLQITSFLSYDRYVTDPSSNYKFWWGDAFKYAEAKRTKIEEQFLYKWNENASLFFGIELSETANQPFSFDFKKESRPDPDARMWIPNPTYGYIDPITGYTVPFEGSGLISIRTAGLYAQLKYVLIDEIFITAGARWDYSSYYEHREFNPRIGVIYHPNEQFSLKLLYGEAFIAPSLWADNLFWMAFWEENGETKGYGHINPATFGIELEPEKIKNLEAICIYHFSPDTSLTLDIYRHRSENLINGQTYFGELEIIPNQGENPIRSEIETSTNSGTQNVLGVDVIIKGILSKRWSYNTSYSYIEGKIRENHQSIDLPKIAPHQIITSIQGNFSRINCSLTGRWASEITTMPSNSFTGSDYGGDNSLDGYFVMDLNLRAYDWIEGMECFLKIDNLFDKKIYGPGLDQENEIHGNWLPRIPFDPRFILLGVKYRF